MKENIHVDNIKKKQFKDKLIYHCVFIFCDKYIAAANGTLFR